MDLFSSQNYREIVRNWVSERPKRGRGELQAMAELLRIPSPVFSQILAGSRELSEDQAFILSDYMGFSEIQRDYFITTVQVARASHHQYEGHLIKKLKQIRERSKNLQSRLDFESVLSESAQAEFYSSWIYSAVRLFCGTKSEGVNLDEIKAEFNLESERAHRIINFLLKVNLIETKNGNFFQGAARTHVNRESPFVSRHHTNWRIRAIERSQNLREDELMFSGPMSLSKADFAKLREKMVALIQEVSNTVKESEPEKLACFNIDFFDIK